MIKLLITFILITLSIYAKQPQIKADFRIISHVVDPHKSELNFYLKDNNGNIFKTFSKLNNHLAKQNKELLFAMNGGMYMENSMPLGLYVERDRIIRKTNRTKHAYGNFYMQPNGIFFITKKKNAYINPTTNFHFKPYVQFATQSGPMLVINGKMHPKFIKGSFNLHVRNGVGILPDGKVLFAISKYPISFYDFAKFFQDNACKNALYLDGAISDIYLPPDRTGYSNSIFGVIIGEVKKK